MQFDEYELYHGINFKKMLKSPTPYCFALRVSYVLLDGITCVSKPFPPFQPNPKAIVPSIKDIKVLCCDDEPTALSWTAGIRLAKYGLQLRDNFHKAKLTQFKLEDLNAPEGEKRTVEVSSFYQFLCLLLHSLSTGKWCRLVQNRASKLVGLRLEKHLEKLREQYKVQKEEEETKRQFYHSPGTARREGVDGSESSGDGQLDASMEMSTHSEQTPEPSPASQQRSPEAPPQPVHEVQLPQAAAPVHTSPAHKVAPIGHKVFPPEPAPKPKVPPQVAPRPSARSKPDGVTQDETPPTAAYNPYPAPVQAAPPSPREAVVERFPSPQQPAPPPPQVQPVAAPVAPPGTSPDKEALFAFAWYHGSIPRDEALHRLEGVGGFDG